MIKKLVWVGILGALLVFAIPKLLTQLSLFFDEGNAEEQVQDNNTFLFPPSLDALPQATNSAKIRIRGYSQNADQVEIIINDIAKDTRKVDKNDGSFIFRNVRLYQGQNIITAVALDDKGKKSKPSEEVVIMYISGKPELEITEPKEEETTISEGKVTIKGKTGSSNSILVNGRFVLVGDDGTFKKTIDLNEGDNEIEIVAKDLAGNTTSVKRRVRYSKE